MEVIIIIDRLVGGDWNMTSIFAYIGNVIIPLDELIFFLRGSNHQPDLALSENWVPLKKNHVEMAENHMVK